MSEKLADICKTDSKNISGMAWLRNIGSNLIEDSVEIVGCTSKGEVHLLTLESLWIGEIKLFFVHRIQ